MNKIEVVSTGRLIPRPTFDKNYDEAQLPNQKCNSLQFINRKPYSSNQQTDRIDIFSAFQETWSGSQGGFFVCLDPVLLIILTL